MYSTRFTADGFLYQVDINLGLAACCHPVQQTDILCLKLSRISWRACQLRLGSGIAGYHVFCSSLRPNGPPPKVDLEHTAPASPLKYVAGVADARCSNSVLETSFNYLSNWTVRYTSSASPVVLVPGAATHRKRNATGAHCLRRQSDAHMFRLRFVSTAQLFFHKDSLSAAT